MDKLDFGDGVVQTTNNGSNANGGTQDITGGSAKNNDTDITNQDGNNGGNNGDGNGNGGNDNNNGQGNQGGDNGNNGNDNGDNSNNSSTGGLEVGTVIEFEGAEYTVAENGDVVDKDGNVFKAAADVEAWLAENEQQDDNSLNGTSVKDLIDTVGIEVKDEKGNDVEFTDDKEGFKSYINSVIELKSNEAREATLNKFYQDNPVVKQFVDYLTVNGGDPRGFGQIPDRSGITVDKDNANQQEQIIRLASKEFGLNISDAYIKYLKDSGGLYDEAVNQLVALQEQDKAVRERITNEAAMARKAEEDAVRAYWENVNNVISKREIAGYKIPESFVKEVNGQKVTITPDDFYDYLYRAKEVDADGNRITGYQRDLDKLTDEELLNKELLDAWLMFTGGTYKDLVNMAIKEHEVHKLVVKSRQQRSTRTIKVVKPTGKTNVNDIVLD